MGNGGFLINNLAPGSASITANNTATNYDINTVINEFVSDVFISENNSVNIDIEMNEPVPFSDIAIINHNIPEGSTINLKLSTTGFVSFYETIDLSTEWYSRYVYKKNEAGNLLKTFAPNLYKSFTEKTYKYIRIEIIASAPIQIGEIFIGDIFQLLKNYNWGFGLIFNAEKTIENVNGQFIETQTSEQQGYVLNFEGIPQSEYDDFKHLVRAGMKVFIPNMDEKECYHGIISKNTLEATRQYYDDSFTLHFMENAL